MLCSHEIIAQQLKRAHIERRGDEHARQHASGGTHHGTLEQMSKPSTTFPKTSKKHMSPHKTQSHPRDSSSASFYARRKCTRMARSCARRENDKTKKKSKKKLRPLAEKPMRQNALGAHDQPKSLPIAQVCTSRLPPEFHYKRNHAGRFCDTSCRSCCPLLHYRPHTIYAKYSFHQFPSLASFSSQ